MKLHASVLAIFIPRVPPFQMKPHFGPGFLFCQSVKSILERALSPASAKLKHSYGVDLHNMGCWWGRRHKICTVYIEIYKCIALTVLKEHFLLKIDHLWYRITAPDLVQLFGSCFRVGPKPQQTAGGARCLASSFKRLRMLILQRWDEKHL